MDDLKQKTDEELQDLMRASINNQHVPSSIYHKAKQELEFRSTPNQRSINVGGINNSNLAINSSNVDQRNKNSFDQPPIKSKESKLFWWAMGIIGAVIAGLVLAFVFGVGR